MKMWISRYALSSGITQEEGNLCEDGEYFCVGDGYGYWLRPGRDAHDTLEAAVAAAEKMRVKKIKSLEKQIEALKRLQFATPEHAGGGDG